MLNHRFRNVLPPRSQLLIMLIYDYWFQFSEASLAARPRRYDGVNQDHDDRKTPLPPSTPHQSFLVEQRLFENQRCRFLFGQFERRSLASIGSFSLFCRHSGSEWRPSVGDLNESAAASPCCVWWVKPLVRCFSPVERIWKGPLVSCNGRLFSMTHLKFKPPLLLFFSPSLIPTGCREFWLQNRDTLPTGPIVAPKRPSKCCSSISAPPTARNKHT